MRYSSPGNQPAYPPAIAGLPRQAGIGFKPQHFQALMEDRDAAAFVEVHAENYMGEGGIAHAQLTRIRERMPLSLHGVGLSIGAETPPDAKHLDLLAGLISRYEPSAFSEHLAWSTHDGRFFNDLLPLQYDASTLQRVCDHIDQVQNRLGVRMLLENPSTYLEFEASTWSEPEFIASIVRATGCGLLLDVNNIYVSCHNNGHDCLQYLDLLPLAKIGEIHLAGHAQDVSDDGCRLLIDSHGSPVSDDVWALYVQALDRIGRVPTLIEWDNDVPDYAQLRAQAGLADKHLSRRIATSTELAA